MASTKTLAQMRAAILRKGDWVGSRKVTSAVVDAELNSALRELWNMMIERWADYYLTRTNIAATAAAETIALPATFYKFRKLELLVSGAVDTAAARYYRCKPVDLEASHRYVYGATRRYRYRLAQGVIYLAPFTQQAETFRLHHIPCMVELVADGDTFDGVNGYEVIAEAIAVRNIRDSLDLPTRSSEDEITKLSMMIRTAGADRDASEPMYLDPRGPDSSREDDDEDVSSWP